MSWFGDLTLRIFPRLAANGPFNNHATLTNGLVSYWKLDEQSGTRYDSITATGNDLTDNNTVTYRNAGPTGVGAKFTAANGETLSSTYTWGAGTSYTFAVWIKISATGIAAVNEIISSADGDFLLRTNAATLQLYTSGFGVLNQQAGAVVQDAWHLVAGYYQDGVGSGLSIDGGAWQTAADVATGAWTSLCIGARDTTPTASTATDGNIARVGMWTGVLSASAITSLYNSGIGKSYSDLTAAEKTGLVSYWNLDEASGTRADSHGSNTLTDNNTVTSATNDAPPPKNVAAKFTSANSEYLSKASAVLPQASDFEFAAWVRFTVVPTNQHFVMDAGPGDTDCGLEYFADDQKLYGFVGGGSPSILLGNVSDTWLLVFFKFTVADNKTYVKAYGSPSNSGVWSSSATSANVAATTRFNIGRHSSYGRYMNGAIDEAALWSRVLTAAEEDALWNSGQGLYYGDTGIDTTPYYLLLEDGGKIILEDGSGFLLK